MKISNKKTDILIASEADGAMLAASSENVESAAVNEAESPKRRASDRRSFYARLFTYLAVPLFIALFAAFVYFKGASSALGLIPPALSLLFFAAVTLRLIPRIVFKSDPSVYYPVGERSRKRLHPYIRIILFSLLCQLVIVLAVYVAHSLKNGFDLLLPEGFTKLFAQPRGIVFGENTRSIASSLGLLSFILPEHVERLTSNLAVYIPVIAANALAIAAASVFIYELVICDHSKRRAKFSVVLLHILPAVLLLMQPFGGTSFFFAFSLLSLLFARKKRLLAAGIAAFAASLFNVFAVLLVVPIAIEWRMHCADVYDAGDTAVKERIKPAGAVIGILLAVLPAAVGAVLKALGFSGLSAFEAGGAFNLNPIGGLLSEWIDGAVPRSVIIVTLSAFLLLALLIFFGARHTRSSHTAFALAFTMVSAVLSIDLSLYSVFALPILASLIGEKCSFRAARTTAAIAAIAALILFTVFLYIKRAV